MSYCPNCGRQILDESLGCPVCNVRNNIDPSKEVIDGQAEEVKAEAVEEFTVEDHDGKSHHFESSAETGEAEYKKWQEGYSLSSALNTDRSAKDFFFPQTENIVEFKMEEDNKLLQWVSAWDGDKSDEITLNIVGEVSLNEYKGVYTPQVIIKESMITNGLD